MITWIINCSGPPVASYGYLPVAASNSVSPRLLHSIRTSPLLIVVACITYHITQRPVHDSEAFSLLTPTLNHIPAACGR